MIGWRHTPCLRSFVLRFGQVGPSGGMSSASTTKIVLYVEADAEHRELLRAAAKGCQVKFALAMADSLYDAIDYLGGQGKYADRVRYPLPTFALVDYTLASFKGTELARWIKKQSKLSRLPVVMFSGRTEIHQMAECYAAGADYYIRKPQRFEDLCAAWRLLSNILRHVWRHWRRWLSILRWTVKR